MRSTSHDNRYGLDYTNIITWQWIQNTFNLQSHHFYFEAILFPPLHENHSANCLENFMQDYSNLWLSDEWINNKNGTTFIFQYNQWGYKGVHLQSCSSHTYETLSKTLVCDINHGVSQRRHWAYCCSIYANNPC